MNDAIMRLSSFWHADRMTMSFTLSYVICMKRTILFWFVSFKIYLIAISHDIKVTFFFFNMLKFIKVFFFHCVTVIVFALVNILLHSIYWHFLSLPLSVSDCELFVFEILQDENLSNVALESREILLRNFHIIQKRWGMSQYVLFMCKY